MDPASAPPRRRHVELTPGLTVGDLRSAAKSAFSLATGSFRLSDADKDLADDAVEVASLLKNGKKRRNSPPASFPPCHAFPLAPLRPVDVLRQPDGETPSALLPAFSNQARPSWSSPAVPATRAAPPELAPLRLSLQTPASRPPASASLSRPTPRRSRTPGTTSTLRRRARLPWPLRSRT